ncbi:MAG: hypothetical protein LC777_12055 [Actinobacteria bacterium]|nr:hypothetical protein [Actinomycetota bacterium]
MQKRNPAARPLRPSHRTTANLGRPAFVIQPAMIGGFVRQQTRAQEQRS